ncbi:hypothetical protein NC652_023766 [Populus alba x Populus x berolinensis]|nr:hypothetical protein NC652_023766 [Populus alba x Populus x berolinensis]
MCELYCVLSFLSNMISIMHTLSNNIFFLHYVPTKP